MENLGAPNLGLVVPQVGGTGWDRCLSRTATVVANLRHRAHSFDFTSKKALINSSLSRRLFSRKWERGGEGSRRLSEESIISVCALFEGFAGKKLRSRSSLEPIPSSLFTYLLACLRDR